MSTLEEMLTRRLPPHDLAAERAILGSILLDGARAIAGVDLRAEDFYLEHHRRLFATLAGMAAAGESIDMLTVGAALRARDELEELGGAAALAQLEVEAVTLLNLEAYAELVRAARVKRELIRLGTDLVAGAYDGRPSRQLLDTLTEQLERVRAPRKAGRVAIVSLPALFARPPAEPCWLVDQLILEAANGWIGAGAKVGKSYLAIDLLLACATGQPWLDHFAIPRPLSVVLVEEEDSAWRVYQRARRICQARGIEPPATLHTVIRTGLQLDDPGTLDPFLRELEPLKPDLIVWDVFNKLHGRDEKRPEQMLPLLKRVDRIRNELGCANLISHHSRKPGATGPDLASGGQKLRGPSEFWAWAENSLYLSPLKGKGVVRIEPESKDALIEPFGAHIEDRDDDSRRWVYDGPIQMKLDRSAKTREAIVALLDGTWLSAAQIGDQLKLTERAIKGHLASLGREGIVDSYKEPGRAGRKLWSVLAAAAPDDRGDRGTTDQTQNSPAPW